MFGRLLNTPLKYLQLLAEIQLCEILTRKYFLFNLAFSNVLLVYITAAEAYSESCLPCRMKSWTIIEKSSILDVWQSSENASIPYVSRIYHAFIYSYCFLIVCNLHFETSQRYMYFLNLLYFVSSTMVAVTLTPSFLMHPFSTPWKHQKTIKFSDVVRG